MIVFAEIIADPSVTHRLAAKKIVKNYHLAKSLGSHIINKQDDRTAIFSESLLGHNLDKIAVDSIISLVLENGD